MRRQRGLTLVELAVTIVVAGIMVAPIVLVIYQISMADSRAMDRVAAVHDTRTLAEDLRRLARESRMRLAVSDAFEVSNNGHTLTIYEDTGAFPVPPMVTIEFDANAGEIRVTDHREDPPTVRVATTGVVDAEFTMPNRRCFELFVEIERGRAAHAQAIRVHAPNVRDSS